MPSEEDDLVFFGTPIEREEDLTTRKKKATAEASGQLRTALPPWKQEVRDEEGRRRFHGAFTGGFSAGYYNTVGSKEGWTPQSFTSSRKNRADFKQQNIFNFLDDDEKAELEGSTLGTSMQYDTFGSTAAELERKKVQAEQKQRPATIPGPVPDELLVPTTESIGVKLLSKMGWRQGRSIKDSNRSALHDVRREARKAFLAFSNDARPEGSISNVSEETADVSKDSETDDDTKFSESTPAFVLNPKQDLHGLGYDPFKQAPEFRENKRLRMSGDQEMKHYRSLSIKGVSGKVGPGFGIGALEELDVEDEDVYTSGYDFKDRYVQEIEEPSKENTVLKIMDKTRHGVLPGFKASSNPEQLMARFDLPSIPKDFIPHHKFPPSLSNGRNNGQLPPPPEVPAPEDHNLKVLIEGMATLVARCGKLFEDLSREKNQSNPLFGFLTGGKGCDFYERKLWEEQQKRGQQSQLWEGMKSPNTEKMTTEKRGKILGEKALEASSKDSSQPIASTASVNVQFQLSDTFTKPGSSNDQQDSKNRFCDDPVKQKRFELFLKEKYEGGLRSKDSGGASNMSEVARAREKLEFEAAAEALQKGTNNSGKPLLLMDLLPPSGLEFTAGAIDKKGKGDEGERQEVEGALLTSLKREEFEWRPAPILCKRFDLTDPYMGKPPPGPRTRSKLDSLIFMPNSEQNMPVKLPSPSSSSSLPQLPSQTTEATAEEAENVKNTERPPVDLYKAIFSDESDDEAVEEEMPKNHQEKAAEAATTALNRLVAGDFLESLGKELGLEVPPEKVPARKQVRDEKTGSVNPRDSRTTERVVEKYDEGRNRRLGKDDRNGRSDDDDDNDDDDDGDRDRRGSESRRRRHRKSSRSERRKDREHHKPSKDRY